MNKMLNKWVVMEFNGKIRRAKCVDIEFETGIGPIFLMRTKYGNQFWLSRREIRESRIK